MSPFKSKQHRLKCKGDLRHHRFSITPTTISSTVQTREATVFKGTVGKNFHDLDHTEQELYRSRHFYLLPTFPLLLLPTSIT
jgi:hypothetical protein